MRTRLGGRPPLDFEEHQGQGLLKNLGMEVQGLMAISASNLASVVRREDIDNAIKQSDNLQQVIGFLLMLLLNRWLGGGR